jgi:plastocyanin
MKQFAALLTVTLLLVPAARAGDLKGKIHAWSGIQPGVVWIDSAMKFEVPSGKPSVVQRKGTFSPTFLVVVAGQTVEMPNQDLVAHNVYSKSPAKAFDLGYYAMGELKEVTFDKPGLIELGCSIHQFMRGKILVVPNPYYSIVDAVGEFTIHNLPSGDYTLRFWSADGPELTKRVRVPLNGAAIVNLELTSSQAALRK